MYKHPLESGAIGIGVLVFGPAILIMSVVGLAVVADKLQGRPTILM